MRPSVYSRRELGIPIELERCVDAGTYRDRTCRDRFVSPQESSFRNTCHHPTRRCKSFRAERCDARKCAFLKARMFILIQSQPGIANSRDPLKGVVYLQSE
jgi:hypothetical protein